MAQTPPYNGTSALTLKRCDMFSGGKYLISITLENGAIKSPYLFNRNQI